MNTRVPLDMRASTTPSRSLALLVIVASLSPAPVGANCTPGALDLQDVWPRDGATGVPTNTRLLIHRHGTDAYRRQTPRLALYDPGGRATRLRIVLDLESRQRTLVLRPTRALAPSTRYELSTLPRSTRLASITTGVGPDSTPPVVRGIEPESFVRTEFGCGPADQIPIRVSATDDSDAVWLRLRVARSAADVQRRSFVGDMVLPVEHGMAEFGHGMCIGNWALQPGQRWFAAAAVLDSAMHAVAAGTIELDSHAR